MKTVKRIFAMLLTVCMLLGMTVSAAAGGIIPPENSGTLTITQAIPNATYSVYKMLDIVDWTVEGTGSNTEVKSSVYYLTDTSAWKNFFVAATPTDGNYAAAGVRDYVEVTKVDGDENYYVEWIATTTNASGATVIDDAKAEAFATLALKYVKDNSIDCTSSATAPAEKAEGAESIEVTIEGLSFGYYLVDTNGGSVVALDTFAPNVEIEEKNSAPTLEKRVLAKRGETYEGETITPDGDWHKSNTASIGDEVSFKTTITVGAGAINYVLHDAMSAGLTFKEVTSVKLYESVKDASNNVTYAEKATLTADTHYTVTNADLTDKTVNESDICDFEVKFDNSIFAKDGFTIGADTYNITEGDRLVVEYTATLNAGAVVAGTGNPNKTILAYGNKSSDTSEPPLKTPPDETTTYTYKFDLVKTNKKNEVLPDAEFMLHNSSIAEADRKADNAIKLVEIKTGDVVTGYRVATTEDTNTVTTIIAGKPVISGLGNGTYYLTETKAPDGYKKLTDPVSFEITNANITAETTPVDGGKGGTVDKLTEGTGVQVINVKKSIFPHTGGMGTTVYYLAGGAIVALVAALAVMSIKKRQSGKA